MKETEIQTIEKRVIVSVKCDVCGKTQETDYMPDDWHEINNHHNHWGCNSNESHETHHVCSANCYKTKIKDIVKEYEDFTDADVDGFEIQFARLLVETF